MQVNPLHAAVPGAPTDPSPYRPSSRRFPDPVYLRVEDVPEFAYVEEGERESCAGCSNGPPGCVNPSWTRAR